MSCAFQLKPLDGLCFSRNWSLLKSVLSKLGWPVKEVSIVQNKFVHLIKIPFCSGELLVIIYVK